MDYKLPKAMLLLMALGSHEVAALDTSSTNSSYNVAGRYSIISRDVRVEDGETLTYIARRELGKAGFAPLLAKYNNISADAALEQGDIVRIPIQVPHRGEFAEVVFIKGIVTVTRVLDTAATAAMKARTKPIASPSDVLDVTQLNTKTELIELKRNSQVFSGDLITTSDNSYVSIAFSSGSVVNLQPDTAATLKRLVCLQVDDSCLIEINTQHGRVTSDVEARDQQPVEFRINTPFASAAVRGTIFDFDASESLRVGVTEGRVSVSAQKESVPLETGYGLQVEEGEPPGQPIELIPAPVFKRIPARIAENDTLEWWSFIDAVAYEVALSTDELAHETLTDFVLPADSALLDLKANLNQPVEPGDYFLTVRAVDTHGLLGFKSNTRITIAAVDTDLTPITTSVVRQGSEFLVSVDEKPEYASGYEIQISSDASFSDPLSVDVNEKGTAVFRIDEDKVFTRARILVDPYTVSSFGEPNSN